MDDEEVILQAQIAQLQKRLESKRQQCHAESLDGQDSSSERDVPARKKDSALVSETPPKSKHDPHKVAILREQFERARETERKAARESRAVEAARSTSSRESQSTAQLTKSKSTSTAVKQASAFIDKLTSAREGLEQQEQLASSSSKTINFRTPHPAESRNGENLGPALDEEISDRFTRKALAAIRYSPNTPVSIPEDPTLKTLEPISGTRLRRRMLPQAELNKRLQGKYVLSVPEVHAICSCRPSGSAKGARNIDLPFHEDHLVLGVLAHRSDLMTSISGSRYVIWKLTDFKILPRDEGFTKHLHSNAREISLFCFDNSDRRADCRDNEDMEGTDLAVVATKHMLVGRKGQSTSAFSDMWTKGPGTLVGLRNPVVSLQAKTGSHSQTQGSLTLSISGADQCFVIGMAAEHGTCSAMRRSRVRCTDWIDKRWGTGVCEYHATVAIQKTRAGRVEFGGGTSLAKPISETQGRQAQFKHNPQGSSQTKRRRTEGEPPDSEIGATFLAKGGDTRIHGQAVEDGFGREAARRSIAKDEKRMQERAILQNKPSSNLLSCDSVGNEHESGSTTEAICKLDNGFSVRALRQIGFDPRNISAGISTKVARKHSDPDERLQNRRSSAQRMKGDTVHKIADLRNLRAFGSSSVVRPSRQKLEIVPSASQGSDSDLELVA